MNRFTRDRLDVRVYDDVRQLAAAAATDAVLAIRDAVDVRGAANVMLATGNSQLEFLADVVTRTDIDWSRVTAFHMDEYAGLPSSHPASFQRYMRERVLRTCRSVTSTTSTAPTTRRPKRAATPCCSPRIRSTCAVPA